MDPGQPVPFQGPARSCPTSPPPRSTPWSGWPARTPTRSLASVEVGHLGGALARPAPGGGAQPSIDANYLLTAVGAMPAPDLAAAVHAQTGAVKDALAPWHAGYNYYNSEETPAPASAVLPPASYRRLQQIKTAYDPDQAIVSAHPVRRPGPDLTHRKRRPP